MMKLPPSLRKVLKEPLGEVVEDAASVPKDGVLVCVGDMASDKLIRAGYAPKIIVYDGQTARKQVGVSPAITSYDAVEYRVKNPQGELEEGMFKLFKKLYASDARSKVYVTGEEDLTALAAISEAPDGATIVYGQHNEGLVIVKANKKTKVKIHSIIEEKTDAS